MENFPEPYTRIYPCDFRDVLDSIEWWAVHGSAIFRPYAAGLAKMIRESRMEYKNWECV